MSVLIKSTDTSRVWTVDHPHNDLQQLPSFGVSPDSSGLQDIPDLFIVTLLYLALGHASMPRNV